MYQTDMYESLLAETITLRGDKGDLINAYFARPLGPGPFAGMVLAHHMPGWDEWYKETTLKFARMGYAVICPNLYYRLGHGTPEDVAAKARAAGGVPDDQVVADLAAGARFLTSLPISKGKVGVFGTCSGGRHAYLAACRTPIYDAVVDCWGGRVVMSENELTPNQPVAPLGIYSRPRRPAAGHFRERRSWPRPRPGEPARSRAEKAGQGLRIPSL